MFSRPGPHQEGVQLTGSQAVELYMEVEDVDAFHERVAANGVTVDDPLTDQWWGDRTFKVSDPNGYTLWFFTNIGQPVPPPGTKVV